MKLSAIQQELYDAMLAGEIVYEAKGMHGYYFRQKGLKTCTNTVVSLINRDLLEEYDKKWNGSKYRAKPLPPPPEQNK